jgi:hypothetical protein
VLRFSEHRAGQHDYLVARLIEALAPHLPRTNAVLPGRARQAFSAVAGWPDADAYERQRVQRGGEEGLFVRLLAGLVEAVTRELRWSGLLPEDLLFTLTHWEALPTEGLRVGCRQVLEAARSLGSASARRFHVREAEAEDETTFVDQSHYPMGGLDELARRGSFENLVLSQLAYSEPGPDIDLFDLRHVEGELLYYHRDGGMLHRRRRAVHCVLDLGEALLHKSAAYPYQTGVLVQGLCLRLVQDLFEIFCHDAVQACFHFLASPDERAQAAAEMRLLQALLIDEVRHGRVQLFLREALDLAELQDPRRKVYALVFSAGRHAEWAARLAELPRTPAPVHGVVVPVDWGAGADGEPALPLEGAPWAAVAALKETLLERILEGGEVSVRRR